MRSNIYLLAIHIFHVFSVSAGGTTCSIEGFFFRPTCDLYTFEQPAQETLDLLINNHPIWSQTPTCIKHADHSSTFCVYTSDSFASGRGISLFTTPEDAQRLVNLPAFTNPDEVLRSANNDADPPFEAESLPGRGIGLIANRELRRGDVIFSHTPVLVVNEDVFEVFYEHQRDRNVFLNKAVERLPTHSRDSFMALHGHFGGDHVMDAIDTNSFAVTFFEDTGSLFQAEDDIVDTDYTIVVPEVSRLNHACRPNAHYVFDPETMAHTVRTLRDVHRGEELTISYIDPVQSRSERMDALKRNWGFQCSCSVCAQGNDMQALDHSHPGHSLVSESDKRIDEIRALSEILEEWEDANVTKKATPALAQRLVALYDEEGLLAPIAEAYTLAAVEFNAHGKDVEARGYAELAVAAGLLHAGRHDKDVNGMRLLAQNPRSHWSYLGRSRLAEGF